MTMREVIEAILQKHKKYGITLNRPASELEIQKFERKLGFPLPFDFKEFYSTCNGFECTEDIFKMASLEDALKYQQDYGENWFHFAEYMIYSDMWSLRIKDDGGYEIFNKDDTEIVLTTSLQEFLERFLRGNVFENGGLYEWQEELKLT
jgi:hypothetical protein